VNGQIGTAEKALLFSVFGDLRAHDTTLVALPDERWNRLIAEIQSFAAIFRPEEDEKWAA
jgi:hypothetical protein